MLARRLGDADLSAKQLLDVRRVFGLIVGVVQFSLIQVQPYTWTFFGRRSAAGCAWADAIGMLANVPAATARMVRRSIPFTARSSVGLMPRA
jgi:hypothetical protein